MYLSKCVSLTLLISPVHKAKGKSILPSSNNQLYINNKQSIDDNILGHKGHNEGTCSGAE